MKLRCWCLKDLRRLAQRCECTIFEIFSAVRRGESRRVGSNAKRVDPLGDGVHNLARLEGR